MKEPPEGAVFEAHLGLLSAAMNEEPPKRIDAEESIHLLYQGWALAGECPCSRCVKRANR